MKIVGYILGACVILAVVRAAAAALILAIVLAIVIGAISRPRETIGLFGFLVMANLFAGYPLTCVGLAGITIAAGIVRRRQ